MATKGQKLSLEVRKKISETKKVNPTRYWLGKKRDEKTRSKIREKLKKISKRGPDLPWWKGGVSKIKGYRVRTAMMRYSRLKSATGIHSVGEWETLKAQYNWTCPHCGRSEPEIKLTKDHIIPLSKGGSNNIENIQPLCGRCNSVKGTNIS